MRGAREGCLQQRRYPGIIPAYAGSTQRCLFSCFPSWDHPRVCGEHFNFYHQNSNHQGSSPRMRGALGYGALSVHRDGIIPAYAGSTSTPRALSLGSRDHPRVCGEHWGTTRRVFPPRGSSPRMRGARARDWCHQLVRGIIPAYAGSTLRIAILCHQYRDHPRVCGEHPTHRYTVSPISGSSPRMRGARHALHVGLERIGIIPAYAGSTQYSQMTNQYWEDHPRVCGEHLTFAESTYSALGSSPRMRGAQD